MLTVFKIYVFAFLALLADALFIAPFYPEIARIISYSIAFTVGYLIAKVEEE